MIDFATRAHNHNWRLDPIIRSLLDTDFYKLLMLQFIWLHMRSVQVTFALMNRTRKVRIADGIAARELIAQLDHVRSLRFTPQELIWLNGNSFYGQRAIFRPEFIEFLRTFQLPEYHLEEKDGQYILTFSGPWVEVTLWEIYALAIINELRSRAGLAGMSKFELDILYAQAKTKAWGKVERLRRILDLALTDFGTRRRHSHLWQEWCILMMAEELGSRFIGTSNAYFAMKHGLEAIGTNAHEMPMAFAALADTDAELKASQYEVLRLWQQTYEGALLIALPDTYGTTQFLRDAPEWVLDWTGVRVDSKDPFVAGEEMIAWWTANGREPRDKRILFSDGLDVDQILALHERFHGRVRVGFGWGTNLTNDLRGCHPRGSDALDAISLVCKVAAANGRPAVKLSDNFLKATGPEAEVSRYRAVFGTEGVANAPVLV